MGLFCGLIAFGVSKLVEAGTSYNDSSDNIASEIKKEIASGAYDSVSISSSSEIDKLLEEESRTHDAETQCKIAKCYRKGNGIEKDEAKAFEWYKKAAEQEFAIAQIKLANCYAYGRGVEKDETKAFEWYKKAAEQGRVDAQIKVAICYDEGKGTSVDKEKSAVWYRKSAEHGNGTAKAWIEKYENSIEYLLQKETETHDAETQYKIAACYANGDGIEKDETEAFEWYEKAAAQGNIKAIYCVGIVYYKKGEEIKGREFIKKAADANLAEAQDWLSTHRETFKLEVPAKEAGAKIDELQEELLYSIKVTGECTEADFEAILDAVKYARYAQFDLDLSSITDIVSIPPSAFEKCESIVSIVLPNGLTSIEDNAFFECSKLIKVVIPESVTEIGNHAFWKCSKLSEAEIPDSANWIGTQAFGYTDLSSVNIPVKSTIGGKAFQGLQKLTTVIIPEHLELTRRDDLIDSNIFDECKNIKTVIFLDCKNLISLHTYMDSTKYVLPSMLIKYRDLNAPFDEYDYDDINFQFERGRISTQERNKLKEKKYKEVKEYNEKQKKFREKYIRVLTPELLPDIGKALICIAKSSVNDAIRFIRENHITANMISDIRKLYATFSEISSDSVSTLLTEMGVTSDMISTKKKESVILPEMTIKEAADYINALSLDDMNEYTFNLVGAFANDDIDTNEKFTEALRRKSLSNISLDMTKMEMEKELSDSKITIICDSAKLPNTFKNANGSILFQCKKLVSAEIPNGTKIIGKVFVNCAKLENIDVPSSMREIKDVIVSDCPCLKSITIKATVPPRKHTAIYKNCEKLDAIYVPASSMQRYKDAEDWQTERGLIKAIVE